MTPQEIEIESIKSAIRHIQTAADVDPWASDIAVRALRKQIPVKPVRIDKNNEFDGNWIKICPSCKRVLIERITTNEESYPRLYNYSEHCKCGQAIDFGGD